MTLADRGDRREAGGIRPDFCGAILDDREADWSTELSSCVPPPLLSTIVRYHVASEVSEVVQVSIGHDA
jgi:hypothetical protein